MNRLIALFLIIIICFSAVSCGNSGVSSPTAVGDAAVTCDRDGVDGHLDENCDKYCDECGVSVVTTFDFYAINDLHGKLVNSSNTIGVEGLSTYLKSSAALDENPIFLSSGDMWQGGSQSNLTGGLIVTDWMNSMGFASMTLGNHEFDWGEEYVIDNAELASFPFLAINIFERKTNKRVEYCKSSTVIECDGIQVGIIGAIGDCYSSISSDKVEDIYFKSGSELTALVKAESNRLRSEGVDIIVYSLHDGYERSTSDSVISDSALAPYYDVALSDGYVDLVFEGHTHQGYAMRDSESVYHLQNRGDNGGISHAELEYNFANDTCEVTEAEHVPASEYRNLNADSIVSELLEKYEDQIAKGEEVLGVNDKSLDRDEIRSIIARLYFEAGQERWGESYNITLGGGFLTVRSPNYLRAGTITYGDLDMLLPFENQLVLCSIKGRYLSSKFINTTNTNYFIYCGEYGNSIKNNIDYNATYYLITDTYSALYAPNNLTIVERYDENVFARDLFADYIRKGNLTKQG